MDGMKDDKPKSGWRIVRRIAAWILALFLLAIGAGYIYLKSLPVPSPEVLAEADNQYRRTRALFTGVTTGTTARAEIKSNATSSTLAAQARYDQLFRDIITTVRGDGRQQLMTRVGSISWKDVGGSMDRAKQLAALYDQGVRVSPELADKLMREGGRHIIETLVIEIINNRQPGETDEQFLAKPRTLDKMSAAERAGQFERYTVALKLMRVANAPTNAYQFGFFMLTDQDRAKGIWQITELENLPPELLNMDLELIAPRGPLDWNRCVASHLDYFHDQAAVRQSLLKASNAFDYYKGMNRDMADSWYKPLLVNLAGVGGAILGPPRYISLMLTWDLAVEKDSQAYAQALVRNELDPSKISRETVEMLEMTNEQIQSRLFAADIELRRGAAVPAPDTIGPDSYFFDPIMQRPYKLYVKPDGKGWVYLCVRREIAPHAPRQGERPVSEMDVTKIRLPVNHPGLEGLPRL